MNKKFLSAILFGALMVTSTGTFVSCKDYDDDIENLQGQIDNLATKSDVEAKLAQLQTALNAAQAESSANAADIAALEKEVASMQDKIQAAVEADMAKYKADIEALIKKVEGVVGKIADVVTSVELVSSYTSNFEVTEDQKAYFPNAIDFFTITEKENVFVKDVTGAITFTKGKQTQKSVEPLLVRVSPTNAVLSGDMISLVNSKGESLNEYVDIEVAPYDELMTTTRAAKTGLWEVKVTLKEWNAKQYKALKFSDSDKETPANKILYAVQVTNALGEESTRTATSSYDVVLGEHTDFEGANELDFIVVDANGEEHKVAEVNNRYAYTEKSMKEQATITYKELVWSGDAAVAPILETKGDQTKNVEQGDDRTTKDVVLAVQGEPIKIKFDKDEDIYNKVAALYVTLDKANAVESAPSELNAWNSYKYEGLNEVVEGNSTTITIKGETPINDYIGFRVYAVNHDGTLVDPDGRAFYVLVGDQAQELNVVETSIIPVNETIVPTEAVAAEALADLEGVVNFTWTIDKDNVPFDLCFYKKDTKEYFSRIQNGKTSTQTNINDVAKIASIPAEGKAWYEYKDGKAYLGTLKAYDANGFVVATLRVSFTKNIPTAAPEGFSIKSTQVVEGVHNCYLIPSTAEGEESWEKAEWGAMQMDQIFNFPTAEDVDTDNYTFYFATSKDKEGKKTYTEDCVVTGKEGKVIVPVALIDNTTKHATTASYNYGMISSEAKNADGKIIDYVVDVTEVNFETVYNCIYNDTYTWSWATREQLAAAYPNAGWTKKDDAGNYVNTVPELTLTYNEEYTVSSLIDQYIIGTSEVYSIYNAPLATPYEGSLKIVAEKTTFTSDENGKQEYFKPVIENGNITKLEVIPNQHNVTADVPSTLTITVVDMYGHERVIKLPAVVKKN